MSHGQATRSTLGLARVTHFIVSPLFTGTDHPPRTSGQRIKPIRPEIVTMIGSPILNRHRTARLTSAIIAVGISVIARAPNTITAPVIAPVAAAVAPSTKALSWGLSRWRLNHGAGTTVNT